MASLNTKMLMELDRKLVFCDHYIRPWLMPNGEYHQLLKTEENCLRFTTEAVSQENEKQLRFLLAKSEKCREGGSMEESRSHLTKALQLCLQNGIAEHPHVLLNFGIQNEMEAKSGKSEEKFKMSLLDAFQFYRRALENDALNLDIKKHIELITPQIDKFDNVQLQRIYQKRDALLSIFTSTKDWEIILRNAIIVQIWNTCAIEGNQLSLEDVFMLLNGQETSLSNDQVDVRTMVKAFLWISTNLKECTLQYKDILYLNSIIFIERNGSGSILRKDALISSTELELQLKAMLQWLERNMQRADTIDGVSLSVLVHYYLVALHPFPDGNGRTSRLIGDYVLMSYGFPPVNITSTSQELYKEALRTGDSGDLRPLIRYVAGCLESTLDMLSEKITPKFKSHERNLSAEAGEIGIEPLQSYTNAEDKIAVDWFTLCSKVLNDINENQ